MLLANKLMKNWFGWQKSYCKERKGDSKCKALFQKIQRKRDRDRLDLRPNIRSKQENKSIMDESKVSKHRAGKRMGILERCKTNRRYNYRTI